MTGLLDRNSHFTGLGNHRALARQGGTSNLPQVYRPAGKGKLPALYLGDGNARRLISRLKWLISTCIVGAAGLVTIGIAMYASTDIEDGSGMMASIRRAGLAAMKPKVDNIILQTAARPGQKTDKIQMTTKGLATKYLIKDNVVERRDSRDFIREKSYTRVVASLSTVKSEEVGRIPPFNPFDLYKDDTPASSPAQHKQRSKSSGNAFLSVRILELTGAMPEEDSQELPGAEAERYVAEADAVYAEGAAQFRPAIMAATEGESAGAEGATQTQNSPLLSANGERTRTLLKAQTTIVEKSVEEDDAGEDNQVQSVIVKPGDTLVGILKSVGAESWQAQSIYDAINRVPGGFTLRYGQEVRLKLAPAASDPTVKEPLKISVFTGVRPEGTVERTSDGEYTLTKDHVQIVGIRRAGEEDRAIGERATLYTSIYTSARSLDLEPTVITKLLRVLAYDVDFKQKTRPGDSFELFFDVKKDAEGNEEVGELLYVAMNVGGETMKYYRYRMSDGTIDFYNDRGSNSRRFLMKKPIRSGRFTSGFGYRRHPLLGIRKMHTGVDWAAPKGTPIMAAGSGTVEAAGRHGGNGIYVRIRHGNGYKTAYSHMVRVAKGVKKGAKVRQGQIIGYVGSTGYSTGPHLHYEVLINKRFTNPLKIYVPRSRQLNGRLLAEFKKESQRIDELMHRPPVKTRIAAANE